MMHPWRRGDRCRQIDRRARAWPLPYLRIRGPFRVRDTKLGRLTACGVPRALHQPEDRAGLEFRSFGLMRG